MKNKTCIVFIFINIFLLSMLSVKPIFAAGYSIPSGWRMDINDYSINTVDMINAGTLESSRGSFEVSGNWTNQGTFNGGTSGTVMFTGSAAATITGANTFANFTCTQSGKQLSFEAGKTQIISGAWTLTGSSSNLITLRSSSTGIQWSVNPSGSRNISFVDVKDSNNISTTLINPTNSIDSSNNTKWFPIIQVPTPTATIIVTPTASVLTPTPTPVPTATRTFTPTPVTIITPTPVLTVTPEPTIEPPTEALTAEFEADPVSGFEPLEVQFTDKSKGNPTSWAWSFGDGGTSSEQNPIYLFEDEGNYTVKLTVGNSKGSDSEEKINLINVIPTECAAAFTQDKTTGLVPLEVLFRDKSKGSPTTWAWEFGDGGTSSEQDPIYIYNTAGIFTVKLTISASCGAETVEKTNLINVSSSDIFAEFAADKTAGLAPLDVNFNDQSIGDPLSWVWEFGDGANASEQNPNHTYQNAGIFTVSLMVSSSVGADLEIKTNLINVLPQGEPTADFKATPLIGLAPVKVQFTDISQGNPNSWVWIFGDGGISGLQNPLHEYRVAGFYSVTLTVSNENGADTENQINLINVQDEGDPVAEFQAEPLVGFSPITVKFTDLSNGNISSWLWDFGDGGSSSDQNPTHNYKTAGIFSAELTVSGSTGADSEKKTNLINVADGGVSSDLSSAFVADARIVKPGGEIEFSDLSSGDVVGRLWDFGDNSTSNEQNPKHSYSNEEVYTVSLSVFNNDGKVDTLTRVAYIEITNDADPIPVTTGTGQPVTTPTPPSDQILNILTVDPKSTEKSFRPKEASVTAFDQNGDPMSGVTIKSFANGKAASVSPASAVTGSDGIAIFRFKFGFRTTNGEIVFSADNASVSITQN